MHIFIINTLNLQPAFSPYFLHPTRSIESSASPTLQRYYYRRLGFKYRLFIFAEGMDFHFFFVNPNVYSVICIFKRTWNVLQISFIALSTISYLCLVYF